MNQAGLTKVAERAADGALRQSPHPSELTVGRKTRADRIGHTEVAQPVFQLIGAHVMRVLDRR